MATLSIKLGEFESGLSDLERMRFRQLRASDPEGHPLTGLPSYDESVRRHADVALPTIEERRDINDSLRRKLDDFQNSLSDEEVKNLVVQLSGEVGKAQSSFGVKD